MVCQSIPEVKRPGSTSQNRNDSCGGHGTGQQMIKERMLQQPARNIIVTGVKVTVPDELYQNGR